MPQSVICSTPICSSYEEIVHDEVDSTTMTGVSVEPANDSNSLESILGTLAEWLLILQGVAEDRDMEMPKSCFKCRCQKAAKISIEMSDLQRVVGDAELAHERAGMLEEQQVEELNSRVHEMAVMLRSDVSILIPTVTPSVVQQWRGVNPSRWILQSLNGKHNSSFILDELITVVTRLLGVDTCDSCNHHLIFCQEEDESQNNFQSVNDRSRKRKQRNPAKVTSPIFNRKTRRLDNNEEEDADQGFGDGLDDDDAMMAEAENAINILSLLEKKKKGLKKDGLYKFVLWREALKDEKSKMSV